MSICVTQSEAKAIYKAVTLDKEYRKNLRAHNNERIAQGLSPENRPSELSIVTEILREKYNISKKFHLARDVGGCVYFTDDCLKRNSF